MTHALISLVSVRAKTIFALLDQRRTSRAIIWSFQDRLTTLLFLYTDQADTDFALKRQKKLRPLRVQRVLKLDFAKAMPKITRFLASLCGFLYNPRR